MTQDLCCICAYTRECMYRGCDGQPKHFCELFDVDVAALAPHAGGEPRGASPEGASNPVSGLCVNCEERDSCEIRALDGDVWHCEEYR